MMTANKIRKWVKTQRDLCNCSCLHDALDIITDLLRLREILEEWKDCQCTTGSWIHSGVDVVKEALAGRGPRGTK